MLFADLEQKKLIIIGLGGKEGLSTYRFLRRKFPEKELAGCDLRTMGEFDENLQKELKADSRLTFFGGENYLDQLPLYEVMIKGPGTNPRQEGIEKALEKGVLMSSATNIFLANKKGKVIGVTGSKGKSTTSTLICLALNAGGKDCQLIGNIGVCALDFLENDRENKWYVLELSSYQTESLDQEIDLAVMVSFFPDHLDYHGGLEQYREAKLKLARMVRADGQIFYNARYPEFAEDKKNWRGKKIPYNGPESEFKIKDGGISQGRKRLIKKGELKLRGEHNLENILGVLTVADFLKVDLKKAIETIKEFKGLPHRLENVGTFKGLTFVDDAISTTPESTLAAIDSFAEKIGAIILGGLDRGYDFKILAEKLSGRKIPVIVLFPDSGIKIKTELENFEDYTPKFLETSSMEDAVKFCYDEAPANSIVLLSCASPSYSVFKNFEDKGEQFQLWAKKLG